MIDIGTLYAKVDADTKGLNRAQKDISSFAKKAAVTLGAVFGAREIGRVVKDVTFAAARYDELGVAMYAVGKNAGYTKPQLDNLERSLRKTGIAMSDSRQNISRLIQANIDLGKATDLARIAQDAAVIAGLDSSQTFTRMINGIQRGEVELLKTIGINVQFEQAYKDMAKQLGIATTELTAYEKTQARTNIVMEAGADIAGAYDAAMGTPLKKWRTIKGRLVKDLKVISGQLFTPAFGTIVDEIITKMKQLNKSVDAGKIQKWGDKINDSVKETFDFARAIETLSNNAGTPGLKQLPIILGALLKWGMKGSIITTAILSIDGAIAKLTDKERPLWNMLESLKGWAAVANGDLSFGRFATMNADDFEQWMEDRKTGIAQLDNELDKLKRQRENITSAPSLTLGLDIGLGSTEEIDKQIAELERQRDALAKMLENPIKVEMFDFETSEFWEGLSTSAEAAERNREIREGELERFKKSYEKHAEKIKEIDQQIFDSQLGGNLQLAEMGRSSMTDVGAWRDLRDEASEYAAMARKAVDASDFDKALKYADVAQGKYASLNDMLKGLYSQREEDFKRHAEKMKDISQSIIDNELRGQQRLRSMKRGGMSDIDAWKDVRKEADEYAQVARRALSGGNLDKAEKYARMAEDAYASLNHEIKDGEKVLLSRNEASRTAIDGVKQMVDLENKALEAKRRAEAAKAPKQLPKDLQFKTSFDGVEGMVALVNEALLKMKAVEETAQAKITAQAERISGKENPFAEITEQAKQAAEAINTDFGNALDMGSKGYEKVGDNTFRQIAQEADKAEQSTKDFGATVEKLKQPAEQLGKTMSESLSTPADALAEYGAGFDGIIEKVNLLETEAKFLADALPELDFSSEEFDKAIERLAEIDKEIENLTKGQIDLLDNKFLEVWEDGGDAANQALEQIANNFDISISKADRLLQIMREIAETAANTQMSGGGSVGMSSGGYVPVLQYMTGGPLNTPSPIKLEDGGSVGIWANAVKAQSGRYFPGFGGGDRIPILGEAGEYMLNKFAVRDAPGGKATADAYNRKDWETVANNMSMKMSSGGYVGAAQVQENKQSSDNPYNFYVGDNPEPISIRARERDARRLFKTLKDRLER